VAEMIASLEQRRASIPDSQQRQRAGLWIASTRVEKFHDGAVAERCKHQGMSWSPRGVLALAALEVARRDGELDRWRQDRELSERELPEPMQKAARARHGRTSWRAPGKNSIRNPFGDKILRRCAERGSNLSPGPTFARTPISQICPMIQLTEKRPVV
jgi:hypothetical protein